MTESSAENLFSAYRSAFRRQQLDLADQSWQTIASLLDIFSSHYDSPDQRLDVDAIDRLCSDLRDYVRKLMADGSYGRCSIDERLESLEPRLERLRQSSTEMMRVLENSLVNADQRSSKETRTKPLEPLPLPRPGQAGSKAGEGESALGSPSQQSSTGLFSRLGALFKKDENYLKADLGKDSSCMRYDPIKKKWLFDDDDENEAEETEKKMPTKVGQKVEKKENTNKEDETPVDQLLKPRGRPGGKGSLGSQRGRGAPQTVSVPFSTAMKNEIPSEEIMPENCGDQIEEIEAKLISELRDLASSAQLGQVHQSSSVQELIDSKNTGLEYKELYDEAMQQLLKVPRIVQTLCQARTQPGLPPVKITEGTQTDDLNWSKHIREAAKADLDIEFEVNAKSLSAVEQALNEMSQALRHSGIQAEVAEFGCSLEVLLLNSVYRLVSRLKASKDAIHNFESRIDELDAIIQVLQQDNSRKDDTIVQLEDALIKSVILEERFSAEVSSSAGQIETLKEYYWQVSSQLNHYKSECIKLDELNQELNNCLLDQSVKTKQLMRMNTEASQQREDNSDEMSKEVMRLEKYWRESQAECEALSNQLQRVRSDYEGLTAKYYDSVQRSNKMVEEIQHEKEAFVRNTRCEKEKQNTEIHNLKYEAQQLTSELEDSNKSISKLTSKCANLEHELKIAKDQILAHESVNSKLSKDIEDIKKLHESTVTDIELKLAESMREANSLQSILNETNDRESVIVGSLQKLREDLEQKNEVISQLETEIVQLKKSADANGSRSWVGIEAEEDIEGQISTNGKKGLAESGNLVGNKQGIRTFGGGLDSHPDSRKEEEELKQDLESTREALAQREIIIETLYSELNELKEYNEGLVADAVQLKITIDDHLMTIQELESQIETKRVEENTNLDAKNQEIEYLYSEMDDLKALYEQAIASNSLLIGNSSNDQDKSDPQALENLHEELEESKSRVLDLESQINTLTTALSTLRNEHTTATSSLSSLQQDLDSSRAAWDSLQLRLEQLTAANDSCLESMAVKDDLIYQLRSTQLMAVNDEIDSLQSLLQRRDEQIEAMQALIDDKTVEMAETEKKWRERYENLERMSQERCGELEKECEGLRRAQEEVRVKRKSESGSPGKLASPRGKAGRGLLVTQGSIESQMRLEDSKTEKLLREKLESVEEERKKAEGLTARLNQRVLVLEENLNEYRENIESLKYQSSEDTAIETEKRKELEDLVNDQRKKIELLQMDLQETRDAYYQTQGILSKGQSSSKPPTEAKPAIKGKVSTQTDSSGTQNDTDPNPDKKQGILKGISGMFR